MGLYAARNDRTLLSHLNGRDIDIVVLLDVLTAVQRLDRVLPYTEGGRDFSLRRVLTAITNAKALVSDVENYSTDLVCGGKEKKNPKLALRNSPARSDDRRRYFPENLLRTAYHIPPP